MMEKISIPEECGSRESECVMEEKSLYPSFDEYSRYFRKYTSLDGDENRLLRRTRCAG